MKKSNLMYIIVGIMTANLVIFSLIWLFKLKVGQYEVDLPEEFHLRTKLDTFTCIERNDTLFLEFKK